MELMADDFVLPAGLVEIRAGWNLAITTSMSITAVEPLNSQWNQEELLISSDFNTVNFDLKHSAC